jgi:hypothetical protein
MEFRNGNLVAGPEQLALLWEAFDAAWEVIAPNDGSSIEVARLRLANAVLASYQHGANNPAALKAAALQSLRVWHPEMVPSIVEASSVGQGWDALAASAT